MSEARQLANITFNYQKEDFRPAIRCIAVEGLEIDNLNARHAEGVAAKSFTNVTDPVIRNSPDLD